MASQLGRLFRSKLPSERRSRDESCDLDSSVSTLSVDEESPTETQSEALPVSLKRSKMWSIQSGSQMTMQKVNLEFPPKPIYPLS